MLSFVLLLTCLAQSLRFDGSADSGTERPDVPAVENGDITKPNPQALEAKSDTPQDSDKNPIPEGKSNITTGVVTLDPVSNSTLTNPDTSNLNCKTCPKEEQV